jgi:hypothetical protein
MKLLNTGEIGWSVKNLNGDSFPVGKIYNWTPSTKKYHKIYEIKNKDYKKFLPAKFSWTLAIKKIKYGD